MKNLIISLIIISLCSCGNGSNSTLEVTIDWNSKWDFVEKNNGGTPYIEWKIPARDLHGNSYTISYVNIETYIFIFELRELVKQNVKSGDKKFRIIKTNERWVFYGGGN